MQTMNEPWTPGPWQRFAGPHPAALEGLWIGTNPDEVVAFAVKEADARLIKEAPEMAELLVRIVENANDVAVCPGCMSVGRHLPGCRIVDAHALLSRIRGA